MSSTFQMGGHAQCHPQGPESKHVFGNPAEQGDLTCCLPRCWGNWRTKQETSLPYGAGLLGTATMPGRAQTGRPHQATSQAEGQGPEWGTALACPRNGKELCELGQGQETIVGMQEREQPAGNGEIEAGTVWGKQVMLRGPRGERGLLRAWN